MIVHHLGRVQLDEFRERFSSRDMAILFSLREHRYLTGQQIIRLHFHNHASRYAGARACSRVMERLQRLHTVTRIQRRVGGAGGGSGSQVWTLDFNGHRLTTRNETTTRNHLAPSLTFLAHTLAIAETRVNLEEITRRHPIDLVTIQVELSAWRQFVGTGGQTVWLKPDLAAITSDQQFEDRWFIEVDLGTESPRTVLTKCAVYEQYRRTGREQSLNGIFPRVLWLTPNETRAQRLRQAIASSRSLHPRLFTVAPFNTLEAIITNQTTDPGEEETP